MESSWNIKVEPGDVVPNVDTRNEDLREFSSLVSSIPRRLEMGDSSESTPIRQVNILQDEGRIVGELVSRCSEQDKELKKCYETIAFQNEQLQQAQELISSLQRQVEELTGGRREDSDFENEVLGELVATEGEGYLESYPIIANVDPLSLNHANEVDLDVHDEQIPDVIKNQPQPGPVVRSRKRRYRFHVTGGQRTSKADLPHSPDPSKENACVCGHQARDSYNLGTHINYYTGEKVFQCGHCPECFQHVGYLRSHILRYHKHVPIQEVNRMKAGCKHCGQTFPDFDALGDHTESEHGIEAKSARSLGLSIRRRRRKSTLSSTKAISKIKAIGSMFTCSWCHSFHPDLNELNTHLRLQHGITSKLVSGCFDCGIGFSSTSEHARHREMVHAPAEVQPSTSKQRSKGKVGTPRKRRRGLHITGGGRASKAGLPHSPDPSKENACVCGHQAKDSHYLGAHIKYYMGEKVIKCGHCPECFQCVSYLKSHILLVHKHVPIQEVNRIKAGCRRCGQTFPDFKALGEHAEKEHGIEAKSARSLGLSIRRRRRKSTLSSAKLRLNRRPVGQTLACSWCGSSFPLLGQLNTHRRLEHGITSKLTNACFHCGIGFSSKSDHSTHRRMFHGSANKNGLNMMQLDTENANCLPIEGLSNQPQRKSHGEEMEEIEIDGAVNEVDEASPTSIEDGDEFIVPDGQLVSINKNVLW